MLITLIHALRHSPPPIEQAFARLWPEARLRNLLDDSLSADVAREGGLTPQMTQRFLDLTRYTVKNGTDAILFTCTAFGPCIDACIEEFPSLPILKPNEAMVEQLTVLNKSVGLLASFGPTLMSMPAEFPASVKLKTCLVEGALAAMDAGDVAEHDRLASKAAQENLRDCDVIALAQFSLARAAPAVAAATGKKVYTTPDCAVTKLRSIMT